MRNAAIAILVLAVLGLWAANHRLHGRQRLLEDRLVAAERKTRPKAALPARASDPAATPSARPDSVALPERTAPLPAPSSTARPAEAPVVNEDEAIPHAGVEGVVYSGLTLSSREAPDPWETLLALEELSEAQRALIESLRQSQDAETRQHRDLVRASEERHLDSARRILSREQQARWDLHEFDLRAGPGTFVRGSGAAALLHWTFRKH